MTPTMPLAVLYNCAPLIASLLVAVTAPCDRLLIRVPPVTPPSAVVGPASVTLSLVNGSSYCTAASPIAAVAPSSAFRASPTLACEIDRRPCRGHVCHAVLI